MSQDAKKSLGELRVLIDDLDDRIIDLLNARAEVAQTVGKIKARTAMPAYVPERERQVLERLTHKSKGPLTDESLRLIYKEIISASLALESPLSVAYLGPEATFTHDATKRHFGLSAQLLPKSSIADVFDEVERGRVEFGVVPVENSTEGVVNHTLDMFVSSDLTICAEVLLQVSHHLLTKTGTTKGITKVVSHPQALAQCRNWLARHLPGVALLDVESTARAAEMAARDGTVAAVASELAASMYDLLPAHRHLEDMRNNLTRFLVIGHDEPAPSGHDRTSVLFGLRDEPGILFRALAPFAKSKINMSRIESRPSRKKAWDYVFFIDIDGHQADPKVARCLLALSESCAFSKVLGSYPKGKLARRGTRKHRSK